MKIEKLGPNLILLQIARESTGCVSYVLGFLSDKSCVIVDPLMDFELYRAPLQENGLKVLGMIDTHTHADHFSGLRNLSELFPSAFKAVYNTAPVKFECQKLNDNEILNDRLPASFSDAGASVKVLFTPGHASDHLCLLITTRDTRKQILLSGDCLFIGDVGRTDLGRGNNHQMYDSLFNKLLKLDPDTEVYPAHIGSKHFLATAKTNTTIGFEKESNPALQLKNESEFEKYMTEGWPPKPNHYQDIVLANLGEITVSEAQKRMQST